MIEGAKYQYGESAEQRDGYDNVLRQALVRKSLFWLLELSVPD
jgi:hypothetical protein